MPPRKGIVKSGNSGTSNKSSNTKPQMTEGEKPLFPPGSKTPLSLLHERCQKNGWDKPTVDFRQQSTGWTSTITLSRTHKGQKESVTMTPHPPYICPTALESKHYAAVYALYRICNAIQLNRVLPAGPREYWVQLSQEHKNIPDHQKWMYEPDPFAARREVEARQAKAAEKRSQSTGGSNKRHDSNSLFSSEFSQEPEVRMTNSLRELTEEAIKKELSLYPTVVPLEISPEEKNNCISQLVKLGFTESQSQNAVDFLSSDSVLASALLRSLSTLETCIEYLILHLPECELPKRFLPDSNSSNPLISSLHSGDEDVKQRWIADTAVKEAGWPPTVVKDCAEDPRLAKDLGLLIGALGKRLLGHNVESIFQTLAGHPNSFELIEEEYGALALGAEFKEENHLCLPLFTAPLTLHILTSSDGTYPCSGFTPLYISSPSVPSYIRLHIVSCLLRAIDNGDFLESGEGFCMAAMRIIEAEWAMIEDNGPPDIASVMQHMLSPRLKSPSVEDSQDIEYSSPEKKARKITLARTDPITSEQLKYDFDLLQQKEEYISLLSQRKKLPAFQVKQRFLSLLENNRVLVVIGETGCGKTTQLPQFILDSLVVSSKGSEASILVTQPRRLSAIGVATRVSAERLEDGSVGYAIRGESKQDERTKLLFCTTGVVLRRLATGDRLETVSHIVVDEVHERSVDGDFLLLELKELLKRHSKLKVVLMSATINYKIFTEYFGGVPLLTIPGLIHPVTDYYLEDVLPLIKYRPRIKESFKNYPDEIEDSENVTRAISRSDNIDYQLIAALINYIVTSFEKGGILIFLPGVQEIRRCIEATRPLLPVDATDILALHANLSVDEQRKVFSTSSKWKIIAATNVAETSITIDDVVYVIDSGKVKEMSYENGMSRLVEIHVTQAQARQRRGRAGRVKPGKCFKLYTKDQEGSMVKFPVPELRRVPLHNLLLTVKALREEENAKLYLDRAIDPPETSSIESSWTLLQDLGAVDEQGALTALGRHLSMLPLDVRLSKMLVLGTIFRCLDSILTAVALLSSKPLFLNPIDSREEATQARNHFASDTGSDILTDIRAYEECVRLRSEGNITVQQFCERNFISTATIREVSVLRYDFVSFLAEMNFIPLDSQPTTPALNVNSQNINLLKSVIVGGLHPQVAKVHLPKSAIKFDKVQGGTVQRDNNAKEFRIYDIGTDSRVFLHPGSVLFKESSWRHRFVVYFQKQMTSKVFIRGVTQVPLYALLLFGGPVSVNHIAGGLTVGKRHPIKLKAWPRIGILVNQMRQLLDAQLMRCIEEGTVLSGRENPVLQAMLALLMNDGMTEH